MFTINKKIPTSVAIAVIVLVSVVVIIGVLKFKINTSEDVKSNLALKNEITTGEVTLKESSFYEELQSKVNQGHQPWRLSPVQVAKNNGTKYGFSKQDNYRLENKLKEGGNNLAFVVVEHDNNKYVIQLIQFAESESDGIWIIQKIKRKVEGIPVEWQSTNKAGFLRMSFPRDFSLKSNNSRISLKSNYQPLLTWNTQPLPKEVSLESWIEEFFSVEEVEELEKKDKAKEGEIDRIKKVKFGKDLSGYFIHSWGDKGEMGVCTYVTKVKDKIVKIRAMQQDLEYSVCLESKTLNQIISSFRLTTKSSFQYD